MGRYDNFFRDDESELPENAPIVVNSVPEKNTNGTNSEPNKSQNDTNTAQSEPVTSESVPEAPASAPESPPSAFTLLGEGNASGTDLSAPEAAAESQPAEATSATLPDTIASRPQTTMRARFSGHALFNDLVRKDWQRAIAGDFMAFDALLFVPTDASDAETDPDAGNDDEPAFTEINTNQKTLQYGDPVKVAVLDCPDERPDFAAVDSDGETDGNVDDVMILRVSPPLEVLDATSEEEAEHPIARNFVPVGSILEWNEALSDGQESRTWWYVHRIFTYGTASVGSLYYCIPARNYDAVLEADHD